MKNIYLFPNKSRLLGLTLLLIGIVLTYIRFSIGIKPEYLNQKVFAIYSSFLEKSYFTITTNNIFEEICGLSVLIGLVIIAFSKEKQENEKVQEIRLYSFLYAVYANIIITFLTFIFIYGIGFVAFTMLNMYLVLILYIIIFRYQLYKIRS
jgi:hypothetical protein